MSARLLFLTTAILAVTPLVAPAQVSADLQAAARARIVAIAKADSATWDRLTSDSFTVFGVNNRVLTKAQRLAGLSSRRPSRRARLPTSTGSARRAPSCIATISAA